MFVIKKIKPKDTYNLRLDVLKTSDKYVYRYKGDFNKNTKHLGAFFNKELVGIVTVLKNKILQSNQKQIQIRGMAVLPKFQNKNIGKQLIEFVEREYKGYSIIWCNARHYAVKFYTNLGFKIKGEKFYIENVCFHYKMIKKLNN